MAKADKATAKATRVVIGYKVDLATNEPKYRLLAVRGKVIRFWGVEIGERTAALWAESAVELAEFSGQKLGVWRRCVAGELYGGLTLRAAGYTVVYDPLGILDGHNKANGKA